MRMMRLKWKMMKLQSWWVINVTWWSLLRSSSSSAFIAQGRRFVLIDQSARYCRLSHFQSCEFNVTVGSLVTEMKRARVCVDRRERRWRSVGWRDEGVPERWHHHPVCQRRRWLTVSDQCVWCFLVQWESCVFDPCPFSPPDFPANNIVKFLLGFTNKGSENFIVESLDASFRYPQVKEESSSGSFPTAAPMNDSNSLTWLCSSARITSSTSRTSLPFSSAPWFLPANRPPLSTPSSLQSPWGGGRSVSSSTSTTRTAT